VKQRCESEQFIVINDNLKRLARDFNIKQKEGEREQDRGETERVCARGRALWREEDGIGNKIAH
jgi:hypothetical protein